MDFREVLEQALRLPADERAALAEALDARGRGGALRDALGAAPLLLVQLDARGVVVHSAGQGLERLGLASASLVGQPHARAFETVPGLAAGLGRALAGETVPDVAVADGWWELRAAPARDGSGQPAGIVVVALDATARRRREDEARDALRFLDAIVENIPDMVFVKDAAELRFARVNRAGEELLGFSRAELIGKNDTDFFPPDEAKFFVAQDRAVLERRELVDIAEETIHTRARGKRLLHTKKVPIEDEAGRPLYLLGISEDVTERKAAEEERRRLLDRLTELDRLKARLVANVSHELRTPLTLVLGVLERLLERRGPAHPERRDLEVAARNARVQLRLVEDLLSVARVEVGALRANYEEVDLATLVRSVASLFDGAASDRRISFAVAAPPRAVAEVDPAKVERIVSNLLANALRETPEAGVVSVTVEVDEATARVSVADSGPGVAPADRERIFEPFVQLEPASPGGTGLGLAIVHELVQLHGGRVAVDGASEGGARFRVTLPRRAPEGACVRRPGPSAGAAPEHAPAPPVMHGPPEPFAELPEPGTSPVGDDGRPCVLIVEDHPELRRFLEIALRTRFRVRSARGGVEGLALALGSPPDLILTDLMMPEGTGEELLETARRQRELEDVPIVVLTAKADDELRLRLLRSGAQDYLLKPVSTEELVARVGNLVATKRACDLLRDELELKGRDVDSLTRELVRRRRESETALTAARVARDAAVEAGRAKEAFLNLVSHELRAPLTSIGIQLERIARDRTAELTPVQRSGLEKIRTSGRRLARLVDALLESARLGSGRFRIVSEVFDPGALVAELAEDMRPNAEAKQLVLDVVPDSSRRTFASDPRVVRLIASNLVDNAIKYTDAGRVELAFGFTPEGALRIAVTDTGRGIAPAEQVRVFEPFVQANEPGRHAAGVGLGLALVKQLTQALGGTVQLASRPGQGSTFAVVLPEIGAAAVAPVSP